MDAAGVYDSAGCFSLDQAFLSQLRSLGEYTYQSVGYCEDSCNSAFVVLTGGNTCYCGSVENANAIWTSLRRVESSQCSVPCLGWPYQNCGGQQALEVFYNPALLPNINTDSSSSLSTSSFTTTTTSGQLSDSTISSRTGSSISQQSSSWRSPVSTPRTTNSRISTSTNGNSQTSSRSSTSTTGNSVTSSITSSIIVSSLSSSKSTSEILSSQSTSKERATTKITQPSVTRSSVVITSLKIITSQVTSQVSGNGNTIFVTQTSIITSSVPTSSVDGIRGAGNKGASSQSSRGLSGGAIAGIVVGSVVGGVLLVLAILAFVIWRRGRNNYDDPDHLNLEESKHYQPYSFGDENGDPVFVAQSDNSTWRIPSRSNTQQSLSNVILHTKGSNGTLNSLPVSPRLNLANNDDFTPPQGFMPSDNNIHRNNIPSTVFEEDGVSVYNGNQRISTSSLPDVSVARPLRVVNPDEKNENVAVRQLKESMDNYDDENSNSYDSSDYQNEPKL